MYFSTPKKKESFESEKTFPLFTLSKKRKIEHFFFYHTQKKTCFFSQHLINLILFSGSGLLPRTERQRNKTKLIFFDFFFVFFLPRFCAKTPNFPFLFLFGKKKEILPLALPPPPTTTTNNNNNNNNKKNKNNNTNHYHNGSLDCWVSFFCGVYNCVLCSSFVVCVCVWGCLLGVGLSSS